MGKVQGTLMILLLEPDFSLPTKKVNGWNTPNIVLKRIQGHFLKISPLKKILEFQDWKFQTRN